LGVRKVFLDNLIHGGKSIQSDRINWKESVGKKVHFIYDDIEGDVEIIDYNIPDQKVVFIYDKIEYSIPRSNFKSCKFGFMLGLMTKEYKYKIGDIINTTTGKIEILECVRLPHQKYSQKGYKYKCLIDEDIDYIRECHLVSGVGCKVCYGNKILRGYNDIATTSPQLLKYLVNKEDGFNYTCNSGKSIKVKCPYCGFEKDIVIHVLNNAGFGCNACSDGISYPEKFIICLLNQLKIEFRPQLSKKHFSWCDKYRYDIYINFINLIIEIHGIQHYEDINGNWGSLEETKENDFDKEWLARSNNIKNYIILDCRESEIDWIKKSVINSSLPNLLNFKQEDIDWLKCHEFACNSLVKTACDLWKQGLTTTEIGKIIGLFNGTISDYLKKGIKLGWCDYTIKQSRQRGTNKTQESKLKKLPQLICLNTFEVFENVHIASQKYNISSESINNVFKNKNYFKSAGKHEITGEKIKWMYYEDYLNRKEEITIGKAENQSKIHI